MLDYLANYGQQNISIAALVVSIVVAILVDIVVVWVYRHTHKGLNYDRSFLVTLLLMGPVIALVITIIGNNIALSIGLVGSLSIVRFRTVIKDSRDLIYILWAIAVGLGAGTENWLATTVASGTLAILCLLVDLVGYGQDLRRDFILVVNGSDKGIEGHARQVLDSAGFRYRLRSMDMAVDGWQVVLEIQNEKDETIDAQAVMGQLEGKEGVAKASLLAPNLTLPV
jgi:hypothetical protein